MTMTLNKPKQQNPSKVSTLGSLYKNMIYKLNKNVTMYPLILTIAIKALVTRYMVSSNTVYQFDVRARATKQNNNNRYKLDCGKNLDDSDIT